MVGGLIGGTILAGIARPAVAEEHHPKIHKAIAELHEAKKELKAAEHDYGGHREAALKAVDIAIEQLEICAKHKT
jgi:hypothetical protein